MKWVNLFQNSLRTIPGESPDVSNASGLTAFAESGSLIKFISADPVPRHKKRDIPYKLLVRVISDELGPLRSLQVLGVVKSTRSPFLLASGVSDVLLGSLEGV